MYKLLILICLLSCGCSNTTKKETIDLNENKSVFVVNIEKSINNTTNLNLNSHVKSIEYIKLETNSNCLIRQISKVMITSSFIFISDNFVLFQFNRKGDFIRQIGMKGNGPGEYNRVMGFNIDEKNSLIFIRDFLPKIDVFDFAGNYLRTFNSKYPAFNFLSIDTNKIAWSIPNMTKIMDPIDINLYITDLNGNILKSYINKDKRESKNGIMFAKYPFYKYDNHIRFKDYGQDTLYTLNETTYNLDPYAILSLGRLSMKTDPDLSLLGQTEIQNELNNKLWISDVTENKFYLFLTLVYGLSDSNKFCIFNKTNNNISILKRNGFYDTSTHLLFWPKYIYQDTILVDYQDAFLFRKTLLKNKDISKYNSLLKIVENLDDEDNPILIIANSNISNQD